MKNDDLHGINKENIVDFVNDLHDLLTKYKAHTGGPVTLTTSNLTFNAADLTNCPLNCQHTVEYCDINNQNCYTVTTCKCPPGIG